MVPEDGWLTLRCDGSLERCGMRRAHLDMWWLTGDGWLTLKCDGSLERCRMRMAHLDIGWLTWRCGGSLGDEMAHLEM